MLRPLVFPCVFVLIVFQPTARAAENEKKAAELKWAKGVAHDFLEAAFKGNTEMAESLLDSTLKKTLAKEGEKRVSEWLNNRIGIQGFHSPVLASEEIAPDQDEAGFKGTFASKSGPYQFSLRVVKDKESGKWRVSFFQFDSVGSIKPSNARRNP